MKKFDFYKTQFENKHIHIDNSDTLDHYISFLINYQTDEETDCYFERHHILPRATFPEYKNEEWNIINLKYEDHKLVHFWLFNSINIRAYLNPLNFMINQFKSKEMMSNAAKKSWIVFRNSETYRSWREKRSNYMKSLSSEEQSRRMNIFWNNMNEEDYLKFCKNIKKWWTSEKRIEKSKQMKKFYSDPNNVSNKSIETKKIWEAKSKESRENFRIKMDEINKNEEKRKDAGEKIKNLWQVEEYLNKMKKRKHRSGKQIKIIYTDGRSEIFDTISSVSKHFGISPYNIRKYLNNDSFFVKQSEDGDIEIKICSLDG